MLNSLENALSPERLSSYRDLVDDDPKKGQAFKNAPHSLRRKEVFAIADKIRRLRNRIAHHEPILKYKLDEDYQLISLFSWLDLYKCARMG